MEGKLPEPFAETGVMDKTGIIEITTPLGSTLVAATLYE
jgi:hypothetical protein